MRRTLHVFAIILFPLLSWAQLVTGDSIMGMNGNVHPLKTNFHRFEKTYITGVLLTGDVSGVLSSGNISTVLAASGVTAGTYNSVTVDAKGRVTNGTTVAGQAVTRPTRALSNGTTNTFTISAKNAWATYTVNFAYALALTTCNGSVYLEYSTDAGTTWNAISSASFVYTISVTLTGNQDQSVAGPIPGGALVRIRIVTNTNVTVTITTRQAELF